MNPELKKRLTTGVAGSILLVGLIGFGGLIGIFLVSLVISLGMIFEFCHITFTLPDRLEKRYFLLSLSWLMALLNLAIPQIEFSLIVGSFVLLFFYFLITAKRHEDLAFPIHFRELMSSLFALVYLVLLPFYMIKIHDVGAQWMIYFLCIVWAGDSIAYFVGKNYGKRKLYPRVSPKKTVEGAFGGLIAGCLVGLVFKFFLIKNMSWMAGLFLPFVVGLVAQIGDLCESFFKRAFDIKDSGSILPGHGGFLDRFDGVVFSLPVMYACMRLLV